ncbi:hypothetical protein L7F22_044790 [Adiantum nelumboides]|nr:hypothetical protein [Adiantum nelumboides]
MFKNGPLPRDVNGRSLATSTSNWAYDTVISHYLVEVGLGTPTREFILVLDTGSNLAWTQCLPCDSPTSCFEQASPFFDPTRSSSYLPLSCTTWTCSSCATSGMCKFNLSYGDQSYTLGDLAEDRFTIGTATIQDYIFGCAHSSGGTFQGVDGILGLGWGALSLLDQSFSFFNGTFGYCLPSIFSSTSATGFIEFGIEAVVNTSGGSSITPMIHNWNMMTYYFVWLKSISVGGVALSLGSTPSFPATSIDTSGTLVDSGTVITRLPSSDYATLRDAFLAGIRGITRVSSQASSTLDTCFQYNTNSRIPIVTFHFDGFDFTLPVENIVYPIDLSTNTVCLGFAKLPPSMSNQQLTIIGYHQMAGFLFTFDTIGSTLGIQTTSKVC